MCSFSFLKQLVGRYKVWSWRKCFCLRMVEFVYHILVSIQSAFLHKPLNRWVFNLDLKDVIVSAVLPFFDSLFQISGAETIKTVLLCIIKNKWRKSGEPLSLSRKNGSGHPDLNPIAVVGLPIIDIRPWCKINAKSERKKILWHCSSLSKQCHSDSVLWSNFKVAQ